MEFNIFVENYEMRRSPGRGLECCVTPNRRGNQSFAERRIKIGMIVANLLSRGHLPGRDTGDLEHPQGPGRPHHAVCDREARDMFGIVW